MQNLFCANCVINLFDLALRSIFIDRAKRSTTYELVEDFTYSDKLRFKIDSLQPNWSLSPFGYLYFLHLKPTRWQTTNEWILVGVVVEVVSPKYLIWLESTIENFCRSHTLNTVVDEFVFPPSFLYRQNLSARPDAIDRTINNRFVVRTPSPSWAWVVAVGLSINYCKVLLINKAVIRGPIIRARPASYVPRTK